MIVVGFIILVKQCSKAPHFVGLCQITLAFHSNRTMLHCIGGSKDHYHKPCFGCRLVGESTKVSDIDILDHFTVSCFHLCTFVLNTQRFILGFGGSGCNRCKGDDNDGNQARADHYKMEKEVKADRNAIVAYLILQKSEHSG